MNPDTDFSIVIPFYKDWSTLTGKRMIELYHRIEQPCEIVLVDDASEEDVSSFVAYWQKIVKKHKVLYSKNKVNSGFGYSMNRGAKIATTNNLVFLSNDVEVGSDFTKEINTVFARGTDCLIGGELLKHNTGWNTFGGVVVPYLNGWFLACRRYVWEILGGFDPRYGKFDFEDVDLSYTAALHFIDLIPLTESKLRHIGGRSFGYSKERADITHKNRRLFAEKWSMNID